MSTPRRTEAERSADRTAAQMESDLHRLEDHIEDAERKADQQQAGAEESLPPAAHPPEGGDEPPTVEGRRDGDDEGSSAH